MNPCCCIRPQRGILILTIIDIVLNVILAALCGLLLLGAIALDPNDPENDISQSDKIVVIIIVTIILLVSLCKITLAVYLRRQVWINWQPGIKKWMWITGALIALALVGFIVEFSVARTPLSLVLGVIWIPYKLYEMWVVYTFLKQLRAKSATATAPPAGMPYNYPINYNL